MYRDKFGKRGTSWGPSRQISTSDRTHARTGPNTPQAQARDHTRNTDTRRAHTPNRRLTHTHTAHLAIGERCQKRHRHPHTQPPRFSISCPVRAPARSWSFQSIVYNTFQTAGPDAVSLTFRNANICNRYSKGTFVEFRNHTQEFATNACSCTCRLYWLVDASTGRRPTIDGPHDHLSRIMPHLDSVTGSCGSPTGNTHGHGHGCGMVYQRSSPPPDLVPR